jgi:hypothetical protein
MRRCDANRRSHQNQSAPPVIADGDFVAVDAPGDNVAKGACLTATPMASFRLEGGKLKKVSEHQDADLTTRASGDPAQ